MKKLSIGIAAMATALCAHAQSSVSLFGTLDAGLYRKKLAGETAITEVRSGGLTTSYFGLRGAEDLGTGWRASFQLSSYVLVDTGAAGRSAVDNFWSRSAFVGLENDAFGAVRLGRQGSLGFAHLVRYSAFAESTVFGPGSLHNYLPSASQPLMTGSQATDTGWSNVLSYTSPDLSGASFALQAAPSEGSSAGRRLGASTAYQRSGFSVGVMYETIDRMGLNFSKPPASIVMTDRDAWSVGGSYEFGALKAFALFMRTELTNPSVEIRLDTTQLGATLRAGTGRAMLAWARTEKKETTLPDAQRRTLAVGYDHDLSKRTDAYAVVLHDRASGLSTGTGFSLGVRHRF